MSHKDTVCYNPSKHENLKIIKIVLKVVKLQITSALVFLGSTTFSFAGAVTSNLSDFQLCQESDSINTCSSGLFSLSFSFSYNIENSPSFL